jgi:hypothetical protein
LGIALKRRRLIRLRVAGSLQAIARPEAALSLHPLGGHMNHSELAFKDQFETAERELASFVAAVKTLFGPEQAELSATDWLNAIEQVIHSNHQH